MDDTIKLGIDIAGTGKNSSQPSSADIQIKRPTMPGSVLPTVNGVNIVTDIPNLQKIRTTLSEFGIEIKNTLYFRYADGMQCAFFYGMTIHGQYVLIESPAGVSCYGGDISLNYQRVDVLPTNILEQFKSELNDIHTGYAYICGGGIHYVKGVGQPPLIFGYDNYDSAKDIFELKKYHFILIPAIPYVNLIHASRLNTIEAYMNVQDSKGVMGKIIDKAGLTRLLTMAGPFTIFMPTDSKLEKLYSMDAKRLQAIILSHVIIGRVEYLDGKKSETSSQQSIARNQISIVRSDGKITSVSSGNQTSKIGDAPPIEKYNGIIYRIDAVFNPISTEFTLPERSDFDDVITIFDINRSTMQIRKAQYDINRKSHDNMFTLLNYINDNMVNLYDEINEKSNVDGEALIVKSNQMLRLFYDQNLKVNETSPEFNKLQDEIKQRNAEFEKLMRVSNRLASLKVSLEKMLLKISRIDQQFHVEDEYKKMLIAQYNADD